MKKKCSGIILAGGLSKRLDGANKAFLQVGGKKIIDILYNLMQPLFDDLILVTNDPVSYEYLNMLIVSDAYDVRSSLTGIHAGLLFAKNDYSFFTACDAPFLKKEVIELLLESIDSKIDVIIPSTAAGLEPLCSIYSKRCLRPIERNIYNNTFKIQNFFKDVKVKKIPEEKIREKDPELLSFFNVNYLEKIKEADEKYLEINKML
ncbi:MAG: molybdenum cofactor guanylyltransferase [Desulfobacterales bacterium]|nr:molybdenum cofactor guanylyltransferase [Desulfobacterales bacterium]